MVILIGDILQVLTELKIIPTWPASEKSGNHRFSLRKWILGNRIVLYACAELSRDKNYRFQPKYQVSDGNSMKNHRKSMKIDENP